MQRRFLLDNDGSNIFHRPMPEGMTFEQLAAETARECSPAVTTYLLCSNAGTCYYPTEVSAVDSRATVTRAGIDAGVDVFGMILRALRDSGRETFVTVRMNDVHNPEDPDGWNTPPIRREHPEMVVAPDEIAAGRAEWMSYCMDYTREPVRDFYLALLAELAGRYGDVIDGIQLDWMRFPRHLPGDAGQAWAARDALTEFSARVRERLASIDSRLKLGARVPPTLEGCRACGMDLPGWSRRGLADFLVLCPFLTTNWTIPFDEFRGWIGPDAPPLYGGADSNYGTAMHHPESLRGLASGLYDQGADGVYLFNFPCWIERLAARPYHWLDGLEDPATAPAKPLQVAAAHARNRKELTDGPGVLPIDLAEGDSADVPIYVPPSALPAERCLVLLECGGDVSVRLGDVEAGEHPRRRTELFVEYPDRGWLPPRPSPDDCRIFRLPPDALESGVNVLRVTACGDGDRLIRRANVALW